MTYAAESGHWYQPDGTPAYEVPNKSKGGMRPTRITDAKKLGLYPSVTTIAKVLAAPALTNWLIEQAYLSMGTLPEIDGESIDDRIKRAKQDAQEQVKQAADRGTKIHGGIEHYYGTGLVDNDYADYITATRNELDYFYGSQEWRPEKSVCNPMGYGGKVDLHSDHVVVDFKTKDFDHKNLPKGYDDQCMQLAAYRHCINPKARCGNLYISRTVPGLVHLHQWDDDELERGWEMFKLCFQLWKLQKRF